MNYFEKQFHIYGGKEPVYRSEMHIICIIGNNKNVYGLEIAKQMGVTKSASSQILKKLEQRGYISKKISPDKLTKHIYCLTEEGKKVYDFHDNLHKEFDNIFNKVINKYKKENAEFLKNFIEEFDTALLKWEKELKF